MANVNLTINGKALSVPAGSTILEAARANGINEPCIKQMEDNREKDCTYFDSYRSACAFAGRLRKRSGWGQCFRPSVSNI